MEIKRFRTLAIEGDAQAENNIGYLYERGLGVPQDYSAALKCCCCSSVAAPDADPAAIGF